MLRRIALKVVVMIAVGLPALSQCPPVWVGGSWSQLYTWSNVPSGFPLPELGHAVMLLTAPQGPRVLLMSSDPVTLSTLVFLFDPATPSNLKKIASPPAGSSGPFDIFCCSHSFRANGNVIFCGGASVVNGLPGVCNPVQPPINPPINESFELVPATLSWNQLPQMKASRFYPSQVPVTTHPNVLNGDPLVIGGIPDNFYCAYCSPSPCPANPPTSPPYPNVDWAYVEGWETLSAGTPTQWLAWSVSGSNSNPPYVLFGNPSTPFYTRYYPTLHLLSGLPERILISGDTHVQYLMQHPPGTGPCVPSPGAIGCQVRNELASTLILRPSSPNAQGSLVSVTSLTPRYYGSSILIHEVNNTDRVLRFGGAGGAFNSSAALSSVEEWNDPSQIWQPKSQGLLTPRLFQNAVILPDRTVFVVGGINVDTDNNNPIPPNASPQQFPEVYDPGTSVASSGATAPMAQLPSGVPRLYHSLACLLQDGRVLSCGGSGNSSFNTGSVFTPEYLLRGPTPSIVSAPATVNLGTPFQVTVNWSADFVTSPTYRVVLIRPCSVTHHFDFEQRYVELSQTNPPGGGGIVLTVTPPTTYQLLPPGYYMLFVIEQVTNCTGTYWAPSVSQTVRVL